VLINADVLSRKTSPKDRNSYPLVGDAASITVIERDPEDSVIHASLKMDGTRNEALMIPAGGLRQPSSPETAVLEDVGDGNLRAKDHLRMDGSAVFNFVQTDVPELIVDLLAAVGVPLEQVDYVLTHQANRFMIEKLADKLKLPRDKMPSNIVEHFGNSSGVTIPMAITFNLAAHFRQNRSQVILASYGVGLTWSAMLLQLGDFKFCEMIEYP
jgi:3-oxoacyl-[acyl-carrier-protein] synthase III